MHNKKIMALISAVIMVGLFFAILVLFDRHQIEKQANQVDLMISAQDLETLANAQGYSFAEMAVMFKDRGMSSVIIRERSLGDLDRTGEISIIEGYRFTQITGQIADDQEVLRNSLFIDIINENYRNQVEESLLTKGIGRVVTHQDRMYYEIPIKTNPRYVTDDSYQEMLDDTGIGFNQQQMTVLNQLDIPVVPQIRSWKQYSAESIDFLANQLTHIRTIGFLLSNDKSVVGFPGHIVPLLDAINPEREYAIGTVEFFVQSGMASMVRENNYAVVRVHSITDKEMLNFSVNRAIERYALAVHERNIRAVYVKLFALENPMQALDINLEYVQRMQNRLLSDGYQIGQASLISKDRPSLLSYAFISFALVGAAVLLFTRLQTPRIGWLAGLAIGLLLLYAHSKGITTAVKLTALLYALVFPVLAFGLFFQYRPEWSKSGIIKAVALTLGVFTVTFSGSLMMAALLSYTPFLIKIEQFSGVKLAHMVPLVAVPVLLLFWHKEGIREFRKVLNQAITYKVAFLGAAGLVVVAYYLLRTGNLGAGMVLGIEERIREGLNQWLGVRPRNKEFFIGYPFLMLLAYLGLNRFSWPLLFPAVIGQISLINTYAHLHTPIMISVQRSILGLVIGMVLGLVLIVVWEVMEWLYKKYAAAYLADIATKIQRDL